MQLTQSPAMIQQRRVAGVRPTATTRVTICRPVRFKEGDDVSGEFRKTLEDLEKKTENAAKENMPSTSSLRDSSLSEELRQVSAKPEYAATTPKISPFAVAFTRRREIFNGRLAMVGFLGICAAETLLPGHPNIMQQIAGYLQLGGLPVWPSAVQVGLVALVLHNTVFGAAPWSATWSEYNLRDIAKRPQGPPTNWVNPIAEPKKFLGITGLGFTKRNELFAGRMAMLGIAAALLQQVRIGGITGPGPLGQIAHFLNISDSTAFYAGVPTFVIWFGLFCGVVGYLTGKPGTTQGEDEIY